MRRVKSVESVGARKWKLSHALLAIGSVYLIFISFKFHHLLDIAAVLSGGDSFSGLDVPVHGLPVSVQSDAFHRKLEDSRILPQSHEKEPQPQLVFPPVQPFMHWVGKNSSGQILSNASNLSEFDKLIDEAWVLGLKAWEDAVRYNASNRPQTSKDANAESCPSSVSKDSADFQSNLEKPVLLPCGLAAGSSITFIGTPHKAHTEYVPQLARMGQGDGTVWVSQFIVELQGLKVVDGEDPPKILHLNPRIRGDWSKKPIIEHNTCYRMQWGTAMRCDGSSVDIEDDTVDGFKRCEKWMRDDNVDAKESKTIWWLRRFIGRAKQPEMTWPFPFVEGSLFVLTIQAGVEGYHIFVGGRHVTSFPYRPGFALEDATGLAIMGDVDIHSLYATNLPVSHPRFSLDEVLEMSDKWRSRPLPQDPIDLFIGILSASNHFAERMAVRKTWMQYSEIKSPNVVARFFVALNPRKEVNAMLKKEAEFFGDIVILPFMDRYELVVLKTIAICEFGVRNVTAAYIMKCDDDNFVRVNIVLKAIRVINQKRPLYMGNINRLHRPLRTGKWAVTYEEWPEHVYPPYANGPGYIISRDIANFVVSQHASQNLRLFKMEDVSMGMWVEMFNASAPVQYWHSFKFCQFGCVENYYTAHYQSPRQMLCLWEKLSTGQAYCCNFR